MNIDEKAEWRKTVTAAAIAVLTRDDHSELELWCFELQGGVVQLSRRDPEDGGIVVSRLDSMGEIAGVYQAWRSEEEELIYDRISGYGSLELGLRLTDQTVAELEEALRSRSVAIPPEVKSRFSSQSTREISAARWTEAVDRNPSESGRRGR